MCKKISILFLIAVLFLGAAMSAQAALVGHYKFDEGMGTTAVDSSATANNATLSNGVTWSTDVCTGRYGYDFGSCVRFVDRTATTQDLNRVTAPNNAALNVGTGSVTMSFMIKQAIGTLPPVQSTLICKGSRRSPAGPFGIGTFNGCRYEVYNKATLCIAFDDNATKLQLNGVPAAQMATGEWIHVVAVYDTSAAQIRFYMNGLLATGTSSANPLGFTPIGNLDSDLPLIIGNYWVEEDNEAGLPLPGPGQDSYTESLTGQLDDVRIYNTALSDSQVAAIYPALPTATPTPFVAGAQHWEIFD